MSTTVLQNEVATYCLSQVKLKTFKKTYHLQGNTILHMIARKGDLVAPTLGALMTLSYRDHNSNKKVYPTDVKNYKHEMPIHIVAMNKKCAQHIIQLLGLFHSQTV